MVLRIDQPARRGTTWTSRTSGTSTTSSHVSWSTVAKTRVKTGSFIGQSQATIRVGEIIEECSSSNCQANCSQTSVSEGSALKFILQKNIFFIKILTLTGSMGILMYCHPGHLRLGLGVSMSCSAAWSGIYVKKLIDKKN